nr:hypothetical protein [Candidatus Thiodiazotropha sp. CDECU1]
MLFRPGVFVANRRDKGVIPCLKPRFGFLAGLAANLLAFQLALRREQRLHELAFRRIVKTVVEAFQPRPEIFHRVAQLPVKHGVAGQPFEVVKNHDIGRAPVFLQVVQQRHHAGTLGEISPARYIVLKNFFNHVLMLCSILTAPKLLALKA